MRKFFLIAALIFILIFIPILIPTLCKEQQPDQEALKKPLVGRWKHHDIWGRNSREYYPIVEFTDDFKYRSYFVYLDSPGDTLRTVTPKGDIAEEFIFKLTEKDTMYIQSGQGPVLPVFYKVKGDTLQMWENSMIYYREK